MSQPSFTPFGYIQNPFYQCVEEYFDIRGGALKTDPDCAAFGWYYPYVRKAVWSVTVGFAVVDGEGLRILRSDYPAGTLSSSVHTALRFGYDHEAEDSAYRWTYWLTGEDELSFRLERTPSAVRPKGEKHPGQVKGNEHAPSGAQGYIVPFVHARRAGGGVTAHSSAGSSRISPEAHETFELPESRFAFEVSVGSTIVAAGLTASSSDELAQRILAVLRAGESDGTAAMAEGSDFPAGEVWCASVVRMPTGGAEATIEGVLTRRKLTPDLSAPERARRHHILESAERDDSRFAAQRPSLTGSWPQHWKNGFYYDFETTRLCTLPAYGIFRDVWPTWMADFARVVLAEGSLDMNRLAYADPETAKRALLTLFRDAPEDNIPCVFSSGGYNMVAVDGSRCGTSPAWCMPFLQIYDLYLRTVDDGWLCELFPYLGAYLRWWLANRTDGEGWLVYQCTWEAGEDNTPRLDPLETGDSIISENVRPVELQAAMAQGAGIMAFFARRLKRNEDVADWTAIARTYQERLHQLFDSKEGRFRDWDLKNNRFIEVTGRPAYWGVDFTRTSPLSLVAVHLDTANEVEREAMSREIPLYDKAPFSLWPSWSSMVLEAAANLGMQQFCGTFSEEIVDRVYRYTDRRSIHAHEFPTPGVSPEWWPLDLSDYTAPAHDAYGWGAQTATYLIRYIIGFRASQTVDEVQFELAPAIPESLLQKAANQKSAGGPEEVTSLGVSAISYRNLRIGVEYHVDVTAGSPIRLHSTLTFDQAVLLELRLRETKAPRSPGELGEDEGADQSFDVAGVLPSGASYSHSMVLENHQRYVVTLHRPRVSGSGRSS